MAKTNLQSGLLAGGALCGLLFGQFHYLLPKIGGPSTLYALGFSILAVPLAYYLGKVAAGLELDSLFPNRTNGPEEQLGQASGDAGSGHPHSAMKTSPAVLEANITIDEATIAHDDLNCDATQSGSPLSTRERNSLLVIIAALATEAKVDLREPYKAARLTVGIADQLGAKLSENTVATHFKRVSEALESRSQ